MSNKDFNRIAAIEKAIKTKYGDEAIVNPRAGWDDEKEKEYINLVKKFYKSILMEFPELLEISAEEICNSQGVY